MFDNNDYINSLFGDLSSTTTTTEQEQQTASPQTDYLSSLQSQTTYNPYEKDDYSSTQNFTEEQSYNSPSTNTFTETQETKHYVTMQMPMIEKKEQAVNLVKSQSRIRLETRMKIVLSVFTVIVACLMFVSVFNFVKASRLEASFADKQLQINALEQSISANKASYNEVTSDEYMTKQATDAGYYEPNESNTITIKLGEMFEEPSIEEVPSNWFNDVCEFFSKLFA